MSNEIGLSIYDVNYDINFTIDYVEDMCIDSLKHGEAINNHLHCKCNEPFYININKIQPWTLLYKCSYCGSLYSQDEILNYCKNMNIGSEVKHRGAK